MADMLTTSNIKPIVELTYNANGTTTVTDANGVSRTHTYDPAGTLTGDLNEYGGDTINSYDSNFRPKTIIDPDIPDPEHRTTTLDWSDDGANLEYIQDASGGETRIKYEDPDDPNNPTEITDPLLNKTLYEYANVYFPTLPTKIEYRDANGIVVSSTSYDYYDLSEGASAGKVELVTDALQHKTHYTYTSSGQPDVVTTACGTDCTQITDYDYDELGRLVRVKDSVGVITINQYDPAGRLKFTINNVDPNDSIKDDDLSDPDGDYQYPPQNSGFGR